MDEWRIVKLGELGEVNRGRSRHRPRDAKHLYGGPYPFIQTGDIKAANGRIKNHAQTYSEAGLAQSRLWPAGTMVITIAANIAETAILTYPACFPDSVVGFIANSERADVRFIEYLFRQIRRQIQHENVGTGSVQDNINLQTLERLNFFIPCLREQQAISSILSVFDDKIDLNRRMNQTLKAMARAIFKDWFVDFGPTLAKAEGHTPYLAPDLWSLFPDRLDDEGKPADWENGKLADIAEVIIGASPNGSTYNDAKIGTPLVNGPVEFGEYFVSKTKWTVAPTRMSRDGDLIICVRGSTTGRHAFSDGEYCLGRGVCAIRARRSADGFMEHQVLDRMSELLTKTTGSVFPNLAGEDIKNFPVLLAPQAVLQRFESLLEPLRSRIRGNVIENATLAQTRDLLLPKLMSGEIRVREAERALEAAA